MTLASMPAESRPSSAAWIWVQIGEKSAALPAFHSPATAPLMMPLTSAVWFARSWLRIGYSVFDAVFFSFSIAVCALVSTCW